MSFFESVAHHIGEHLGLEATAHGFKKAGKSLFKWLARPYPENPYLARPNPPIMWGTSRALGATGRALGGMARVLGTRSANVVGIMLSPSPMADGTRRQRIRGFQERHGVSTPLLPRPPVEHGIQHPDGTVYLPQRRHWVTPPPSRVGLARFHLRPPMISSPNARSGIGLPRFQLRAPTMLNGPAPRRLSIGNYQLRRPTLVAPIQRPISRSMARPRAGVAGRFTAPRNLSLGNFRLRPPTANGSLLRSSSNRGNLRLTPPRWLRPTPPRRISLGNFQLRPPTFGR